MVISENIVFFDGGEVGNPTLIPPNGIKWICYQISAGHLWIEDSANPNQGLCYGSLNHAPTFIRLPRSESLEIMSDSQDLCNAIRCCIRAQSKTLHRGVHRQVFSDESDKYCCLGTQAGRANRGVQHGYHRIKKGFTNEHWDCLYNTLKKGEQAFYQYASTNVIRQVFEAKNLIQFKTMQSSESRSGKEDNCKSARIFNGIGFGVNFFLRCHTDIDFTQSIVHVHTDSKLYKCLFSKNWHCCCFETW